MPITHNHAMCATPNIVTRARRRVHSDVRARDLPGIRWILLGLYLLFLTAVHPVLLFWGLPLPLPTRLIQILVFLLLVVGAYRYARTQQVHLLYCKSYMTKIKIWFVFIVILAGYGLFFGNGLRCVIIELFAFVYMGIFLFLGGDDRFWRVLEKHLTILFYVGTLLILLFFDIPMPKMPELVNVDALLFTSGRYNWSIGYYLRPLIAPGLLLGMLGMVRREGGIWRTLQILAWFFYFVCEVGLFKFRSPASFVILAMLSFLLLRPFLERRIRPGISMILLSLGILAFGYYTTTEAWEFLLNRIIKGQEIGILTSRQSEFDVYMSEMGWMVLVGRGLGGHFDASSVFRSIMAYNWLTLHCGVMIFTLKGGVLFLLLFVSFLWPSFYFRPQYWYQNPCNLTAALLIFVYYVRYATVPIMLTPMNIFIHIPAMMILARFGRKTELDKRNTENSNSPR